MFRKPYILLSLSVMLALTLSACNQEQAPVGKPMAINSDPVATVNGVKITQTELDAMKRLRQMNGQMPSTKDSLDDLIGMELLRQKAVAEGAHEDPKVAEEINRQATNALVSAYVQQMMENQPISDADLQKEYDARMGEHPGKEYKARHILSETEEEATANIEALKKGTDFAELAKEKSIEPGASARGGDLGWANPDSFVPEFSKAMQELEPGKHSQEPVQTQFGWHVILLEDVRDAQRPDIESVKPQLRRMMANQRLMDLVTNMRENAQIEILVENQAPASQAPQEAPGESAPEEAPADNEAGSASSEAPSS